MKKNTLLGLAAAVSALLGGVGVAHAEGSFTGNVALASDYVFRGISQTEGGPAVSGGFDYTNGIFYAGTWASNVSSATISSGGLELDVYAGVTPTLGPVSFNFGVIGYFYPGADDQLGPETDFYEGKASASFSPIEPFTLTGSLFYSPDFALETGDAVYYEIAGAYAVSDAFGLKAAFGVQDVDEFDSYETWLVGATYAVHGFTLGLTYTDTDDAFDAGVALSEEDAGDAITFSISRAL